MKTKGSPGKLTPITLKLESKASQPKVRQLLCLVTESRTTECSMLCKHLVEY